MKDKYPVVESYSGLCEGFMCSEHASTIIQVSINKTSNILLHLCNRCAKIFKDPDHFDKEALEQQVERPACSNTSSQNQPTQQHEVLLNG
jgi:ribosome-binding protein aMBF1 (putative translation factor)